MVLGTSLIVKAGLQISVICLTCWPENSLCFLKVLVRFCHHFSWGSTLVIDYCNQKCLEFWPNNKPVSEARLSFQKTTINFEKKFFTITLWHHILYSVEPVLRKYPSTWKRTLQGFCPLLFVQSVICSPNRINESSFPRQ